MKQIPSKGKFCWNCPCLDHICIDLICGLFQLQILKKTYDITHAYRLPECLKQQPQIQTKEKEIGLREAGKVLRCANCGGKIFVQDR